MPAPGGWGCRETDLKYLGPQGQCPGLWVGAPHPQELVHGEVEGARVPCKGWRSDFKHQSWSLPWRGAAAEGERGRFGYKSRCPTCGDGFCRVGCLFHPSRSPPARKDSGGACQRSPHLHRAGSSESLQPHRLLLLGCSSGWTWKSWRKSRRMPVSVTAVSAGLLVSEPPPNGPLAWVVGYGPGGFASAAGGVPKPGGIYCSSLSSTGREVLGGRRASGSGSCPCGAASPMLPSIVHGEKDPLSSRGSRVPGKAQLTAFPSPRQPASSTRWRRWGWQPTATASATSTASSTRRSGTAGRYGQRRAALAFPRHSRSPESVLPLRSGHDRGVQTLSLCLETAGARVGAVTFKTCQMFSRTSITS